MIARVPAPEQSRRRGASLTASAATLALVAAGALAPALTATAAGADPYAAVGIVKVYDGTGHEAQETSTFVNTANGFTPGDNTPTDGVVSTNDAVAYDVSLRFEAGPARQVVVNLDVPSALEWRTDGASFCKNGTFVKATRSGNSCIFTVPAGAVESITARALLYAKDTGGVAIRDQRVSISVGLPGSTFQSSTAAAVTVVSAPATDIVMTSPSYTNLNSSRTGFANNGSPITWTDTNATGYFLATPVAMRYPGWDASKGVSTSGTWFGTFDVSGMPEGAAYSINGSPVDVVGGLITIPPTTGQVRLDYTIADGWPEQEPGTSADYMVRVNVDPTSFSSSAGLLNNGTGFQPGDGRSQTFSTYDPNRGSMAGRPYPNNDYTIARVNRPEPITGWISKLIYGPYTYGKTVWEPENTVIEANDTPDFLDVTDSRTYGRVGPETMLRVALRLHTDLMELGVGDGRVVVGDSWNWQRDGQYFDSTRPITVSDPAGNLVPSSQYVVQYATTVKSAEQLADPADPGWLTGTPPASAATLVKSIRVVFASGMIQQGTGTYVVSVPVEIADASHWRMSDDGTSVPDRIDAALWSADVSEVLAPVESLRYYTTIAVPSSPTVTNKITVNATEAHGGDTLTYTVTSQVHSLATTSSTVTPTVTVTIDPCEAHPVNRTPGWTMEITPAIPSPSSGRICGDPDATPAVLTFRPVETTIPIDSWANAPLGDGYVMPNIMFDVEVVQTLTESSVSANVTAVTTLAEAELPASSSVTIDISRLQTAAASIWADFPLEEITKTLSWTAQIYSVTGQDTDTVIVLPRAGTTGTDAGLIDQVGSGAYTGPTQSDYHGSYTVGAVTIDPAHTVNGTELFYTTAASPDMYSDGPWIKATLASDGTTDVPANATALRVVSPEPNGIDVTAAKLNIAIDPTGNLEGDVYVMWMGESTSTTATSVPAPWPAVIETVSSEVSGTVWWDDSDDGNLDAGEPRIPGIVVTLHQVDANGVAGPAIATTTTDEFGFYQFTDLVSGRYITRMSRGDVIPNTVTSYYNQEISVDQTYSYLRKYEPLAIEQSAVFNVPFDSEVLHVDYGFNKPDPRIALDKSEAEVTCDNGVCTVVWYVTTTNTGSTALSDITLHDGMPNAQSVIAEGAEMLNSWADVTATGGSFIALDTAGHLYSWGSGKNYLLGTGSTTDNAVPTAISTLRDTTFLDVEADTSQVLALDTEGNIWTWGADAATPTMIPAPDGAGFTSVAGSPIMDVALAADGSVWDIATMTPVAGLAGVSITQIDATATGTPAIGPVLVSTDGTVWTIDNAAGDVTHLTGFGGENVVQVATSGTHVLAVTDAGHVWAWGSNAYGQLGQADTTLTTSVPAQVTSLSGITSVGVGDTTSYAVDSNGDIWSFGDNSSGQLGADNTFNAAGDVIKATRTWGDAQPTTLDGGTGTLAFVLDSGEMFFVGANDAGQSGSGALIPDPVRSAQPVQQATITPVVFTKTGLQGMTYAGIAIDDAGDVWTWGMPLYGQRGDGTAEIKMYRSPEKVTMLPDEDFVEVLAVSNTAYSVTESGDLWAWGQNYYGMLGVGSTDQEQISVPTQVIFPQEVNVTQIAASGSTVLALAADGSIWGWGLAEKGLLGMEGGGTTYYSPIKIADSAGHQFTQIEMGWYHAIALASDGTVWTWGDNSWGQLADGTQSNPNPTLRPVAGLMGHQIIEVGATNMGSAALTEDGTVFTWGANLGGSLGTGDTEQQMALTPVQALTGTTPISKIYAGLYAVFAVQETGNIIAWGQNAYNTLGLGESIDQTSTPMQTDLPATISDIDIGNYWALFIDENGALSGRGINAAFNLDQWDLTQYLYPDRIPINVYTTTFRPWVITGQRLVPTYTETGTGRTERGYRLPDLAAGESTTVKFAATYPQPRFSDAPNGDVVVNQAWVDSPVTPKAEPADPVTPTPGTMDALGAPDNPECNTDATTQSPEDSCDQVPALIPPSDIIPASVQGIAWVDADHGGTQDEDETIRVPGVTVTLFAEDGVTVVATTTTDENGAFRFDNVPPNRSYRVGFSVSTGEPPATGSWTLTAGHPATPEDLGDSDADNATTLSDAFTVLEGGLADHIDVGVYDIAQGIVVDKTSAAGDDVTSSGPDGTSDPCTVVVTITNSGAEALTELTFEDITLEGPAIEDWDCEEVLAAQGTLIPGESVTCQGTLAPMTAPASHEDKVVVTGRGTGSQVLVTDDDGWRAAVVEPEPPAAGSITVFKIGDNGSPLAGAQFTLIDADTGEPAAMAVSQDGTSFTFTVSPGRYTLTETRAPDGYALMARDVDVTVTLDPALHIMTVTPITADPLVRSSGMDALVVTNTEVPWTLPSTGGSPMRFALMSTLIALSALSALMYARRRQQLSF